MKNKSWSSINRQRFHLITKRNRTGLREDETKELERLTHLARERVDSIAPLPTLDTYMRKASAWVAK